MRRILIIGMGAGDPDYMTVQAIDALNRVDVFFIPDKGAEKAALHERRREICERFIKDRNYRFVGIKSPERAKAFTDYRANVAEWHALIEKNYETLLTEALAEDECGAFLIWGDPTLYDSTLRIIESLHAKGVVFEYEVIPGISSIQALAAKHRVALNRIGEPVLIAPARKIASGIPQDADSVVVVLDGEQTFKRLDGEAFDIYWGAYLGTEQEILVAGKLADVKGEIEARRDRARRENGWIMDTYLLRKREVQ